MNKNAWMKIRFTKALPVATLVCLLMMLTSCIIQPIPKNIEVIEPAKIAVVLGAGASKGFAHIGVLKMLEAHNVPIHMIVGTSAGSLVGSLYASGKNAFDLQAIAMKIEQDNMIDYDWMFWKGGVIKGEKLENFVNNHVNNLPIEKLTLQYFAVATNANTGKEMVFGKGNTGMAVRASCCVPGVFQPLTIGKDTYIDGSVVNPVAVDVARRYGADVVIAVDISGGLSKEAPNGMVNTMSKSFDIMYMKNITTQLENADVVIRPDVKNIGFTDLEKCNEAIFEGEKATCAVMPAVDKILAQLKQQGRLPN